MPRWFVSRPIDKCHESELVAYGALNALDDSWTIRWGYEYLAGKTPREGDFLILGPDAKLLVLEAKSRDRFYSRTGSADGSDSSHPADEDQVQSQKAGVLAALGEAAGRGSGFELPFIMPAIFSARGNSITPFSKACPISVLCGPQVLSELPKHWAALTGGSPARNPDNVRRLFASVYGDASPEAEAKYLSATDRLILQRLSAKMELLEALGDNRQMLVRGGPGSGKTWLAERFAQDLAKQGKRVLFLCYNKALGAGFRRDFARTAKRASEGSVIAHTWESLAEELAAKFGEKAPAKPQAGPALGTYYEETLPAAMLDAVTAQSFEARFDALVVDEAQDHNTAPVNWWDIYLALLRDGAKSAVAAFYDTAQRPKFRAGAFDVAALASTLSQPAHFRLLETRRYTRPVYEHLRSLVSPETQALVDGLRASNLLAGPNVVLKEFASRDAAKSAAAAQLKKWFKDKLVEPSDTLVLTRRDPFSGKQSVFTNCETFAGYTLVAADAPHALDKGNLRAASFNKSKGLDARAVILLDTWPWADLPPGQRAAFWIAASRARQLLAVISTKK